MRYAADAANASIVLFCENVGMDEYILRAMLLFFKNVGIDECFFTRYAFILRKCRYRRIFFACYAFILRKCRYRAWLSVNYDIFLFCGFWGILLWFLMIDKVFDVGSEANDV